MKFHHTLNQAPRSLKDGRHRKTSPAVHSRSARQSHRTNQGADPFGLSGVPWGAWGLAAEPEPIESAGIRAGEIIAHRGWLVDRGLLRSIYRRENIWTPGEPMTGDVRGEYGVHAFKRREQVDEYCMFNSMWTMGWVTVRFTTNGPEIDSTEPPMFAIGTVALWGEVIEHERGYRAEFAKVASIDVLTGTDEDILADLRAAYR